MTTPRDGASSSAERARDAYNAAADTYDDPALSFWEWFGRRTIERLDLPAGAHVLDVCAGSGASAIAAAERVGPTGSVLAVDLAERLLELAEQKAAARRLSNFRTRAADMTSLGDAGASFDAVICTFGIFLVDDMAGQLRMLWSLLRPGGVLAVTTWGARSFEPAASVFWDAVGNRRPELRAAFNPWERIADPDSLRTVFEQAGIPEVSIEQEAREHPVASPQDFWTIAMGSGFRWTIDRLSPEDQQWLRDEVTGRLASITSIHLSAIYAAARRPAVDEGKPARD